MSRECKEMQKRIGDPKAPDDEDKFQWLLPYVRRRDLPADFGISPQDLRLANKLLSDRFSQASAGIPGNDIADLQLIQQDWLREKARENSRKGKIFQAGLVD